jgi:hypothetical protein
LQEQELKKEIKMIEKESKFFDMIYKEINEDDSDDEEFSLKI